MSDYRTVTNGAGKYLGRLGSCDPLGWIDAAHASCVTVDVAETLAAVHGGSVVRVPIWNPKTKRYEA